MAKNKSAVRMRRGADSHRRGWLAEFRALTYLMLKGYWPCAMRYRTKRGEVDLIMRRGNLFIAVEVKARPDAALGHEAMNPREWLRRHAAMMEFMQRGKYRNASIRFDLVVVSPYFRVQHVESAWQPEFSSSASSV